MLIVRDNNFICLYTGVFQNIQNKYNIFNQTP